MTTPNEAPEATAPPEREQTADVTLKHKNKRYRLVLRNVDVLMENCPPMRSGVRVEVTGNLADWVEGPAAEPAQPNTGCPAYYRFPTCQVADVSEHLTSNGGQAVQYIARATRLDGRVKGEPIRDLEKARDFLTREIQRLKETR